MGLLSRLKTWVLSALAAIAVAFSIYLSGRRAGSREAERDEDEKTLDAHEEKADVEKDVGAGADGTAAERLRDKWSRD